jgi:hypothetical protein
MLCLELGLELFPIASREPREPVDLLDKQDIAIMGIGEQPEENRAGQLGAGLVLFVPGHDLEATLRRKDLELVLSPARILLVG